VTIYVKKDRMLALLPEGPFTLRDVMHLDITRYALYKLINEGSVEKLGHGLYKKTKDIESSVFDTSLFENVFARSKQEGCICLWSALEYYDLTEEFIEQAWIYIPYEKNIRVSEARTVRKRNLNLSIGVDKKKGFQITSIERTLIDCFLSKKHISLKDSLEVCRKAINMKKTNFTKLAKLAKQLEVFEKVKGYFELIS